MAVQPEDIRLLANSRFRRLMEARAVAQTGQNAMLYTLLILVVNETASSIHSTLLVTAWMLPCIVIGVPAGGLADVLAQRALIGAGARRPARAAGGRADGVAVGGGDRPVDEPAGLPGAGLPDGRGHAGEGAGGSRPPLHPRRAEDRY